MKKQVGFIFAAVVVIVSPILAVLPEEPHSTIRSISSQGIIIPGPAAGAPVNAPARLPGESNQNLITATESSRALQQFISQAGEGWIIRCNPITGVPNLIAGRAMALQGVKTLTKEKVEAACLDFVAANANLLRIQPGQLRLTNKIKAGGRWFVNFQQVHEGIPVLGGRLTTSFTTDDRLIMLTSDIYPDISAETKPAVDKKGAMRIASDNCGGAPDGRRISDAQLCIVPLRQPDGFNYTLCWKLYVFQPAAHKKWQYLVDAATGKIISKLNVLVYQSATGTVQGEYKPEFASDSAQVAAFPYEDVIAQGFEIVIKSWNFDTNPGWTNGGQWTFGPAVGGGSYCGDPVSAYTGTNIYGYNIGGDYENSMPAYHLTTQAIDCSAYKNVHLKFMRWLGVEYGYYDNASIEVSNDGFNWVTVWQNPMASVLCDTQWGSVIYDISTVADGQPTVYVRWVMGPTDFSESYPGWSIDDVKIVSISGGTNTVQTQTDGTYSVVLPEMPTVIRPGALISELKGLYCDINYSCGPDAQFKRLLTSPEQVVDFTWNSALYNAIVESSVYWHVNYIHDYYMAMDTSLAEPSPYNYPAGLNYPMPVTVQEGCAEGYCNAYWDGEGMTFGASDGQFCDAFGLYCEVVYHEYTHGVTEKIYDGITFPYAMEQGAMNEAWSDYFGCILSPSQNHFVGDGGLIFGSPNGFRTLENSYRRETDWYNEVHEDSQMFSAGLWQVRKMLKNEIGADTCDQMVHFARYAYPQSFEEYLLALLLEDDIRFGDNNLSNGTPHAEVIFTAFGDHGIGGIQYAAPSVVIDDAQGNANGKLEPGETVNMSLTLTNDWANATNVTVTLKSNDPFVNIISGSVNFPSANYGGHVNNAADPFIISLDAGCPETHTINFILDINADGPYNYSRTCLFTYFVAIDQLGYGDGQADAYLGWGGNGGGLAVRLTPKSHPYYPSIVRLFPSPYAASTITVKVWDDDGPRGTPGKVLGSIDVDVPATNDWFEVDISSLDLKIKNGSFYVGWIEGGNIYYNGVDNDPPYYGRSWVYSPYSKAWYSFEYYGILANLMIQVRECSVANRTIQNLTTGKKYCCVQSAINEAGNGDEIVLDRGTYYGNIDFKGKNLVVRSIDPEDSAIVADTVIKGGNQVVSFISGEDASCVLTGLTITGGNRGIDCDNSAPQITHCVIADNRDEGIYAFGSSLALTNCIFANNGGAGCAAEGQSKLFISNCTFVANQDSGIKMNKATATVDNSVLWSNLPAQITRSVLFSKITVNYNDIQGGWAIGQGNIDVDPCFADANNGDYHVRSAAGRWEPNQNSWVYDANTSLCIDGGDPNSDWKAELWPNGRRINMGAYGGTREASMSPNTIGNVADLNNDNTVDIRDFAIFANSWLIEQELIAENLDRSGEIGLNDLAVFVENWLWQEQ